LNAPKLGAAEATCNEDLKQGVPSYIIEGFSDVKLEDKGGGFPFVATLD
jgi:hypothetical protein